MPENDTTTRFRVDISDLKAGMQEASRYIREANSEFKASTAGMDNWANSADGVTAKLKQLGSQLDGEKRKLALLENQYAQLVAEQGESSAAAQEFRIKLNNQKAAVAAVEKQIGKYEKSLDELSDTSEDTADALDDIADSADDASKGIKDVGDSADDASKSVGGFSEGLKAFASGAVKATATAVTGLVTGFLASAEATREYREDINKLQTAFQSAGHTTEQATETYKELFSVFGEEDRAVEAAQQIAKLAKSEEDMIAMTNIATGVWGTFGDSLPAEALMEAMNSTAKIGAVQGNLADALEWSGVNLDEFNAKLATMATEEERSAYITDTLNGLYSGAADNYRELNGSIMDAQRAQSELTDAMAKVGAVAEPIMTAIKFLGAEVLNTLIPDIEKLGTAFMDLINGAEGASGAFADSIVGILQTMLDKIIEYLPQALEFASALIIALVNALRDILPKIVETIYNMVPDLIVAVSEIITAILETMGEILPKIISTVIEAIPKIVETIINAIPQLIDASIEFWMAIVEAIPVVIEELLTALPDIIDTILTGVIEAIPKLLDGAIQLFTAIVDAIPTIIDLLVDNLPDIIDTILEALSEAIPALLDASITLLMALIDAIPTILDAWIENLPRIINLIVTTIVDALPILLDGAVTLLMAIVQAIPIIINALVPEIPKIVAMIVKVLLENLPVLIAGAIQLFMGILKAIPEITIELVKAVPSIVGAVVTAFGDMGDEMWEVGKDLLGGIWSGIKENIGGLVENVKGVGSTIVGGFKGFFQIESPSKLMKKEVGGQIVAGLANGIKEKTSTAINAVKSLNSKLMDPINNVKNSLSSVAGDAVMGSSAGNTVIFNQNNYSPKSLSRLDIYRQTKNQLDFAGGGV